jgi:pimeloyl-ACP methyl ester carboxylesterase
MKRFFLFVGLISFLSCGEDPYKEGDFFFLVNKGAKMPIVVRGNIPSGIFIVFIHGGPGGTALQKIGLPAFTSLEKNYGTVFWDQRGSGSSQGNSTDKRLTLDQFVEDLDKLIDLLHAKYNSPKIFLMGHSWGGCLGTAYLSNPSRQNKIRGWIEVDGAHNNPMGDDLSLAWVTDYAHKSIAQNIDVDFWKYALDWYAQNPNFTSDQLEHYVFVTKANGYIHDPDLKRDPVTFPDYSYSYVFNSPADITQVLTNYNHVIQKFIISDIDLTSQMKNITIPTLIVWGKYDGVIPFAMAVQAFTALGTNTQEKAILELPDSGHEGFYEEPDLFVAGVQSFVERYK